MGRVLSWGESRWREHKRLQSLGLDRCEHRSGVVGLHYTDPDATILIDFPGQSVSFGSDAASGSPIVELRMSADDGHKFWLGKLNMTLAMAQRKVKMEGSAAKALKLLPLTKPMFASYETLLRDAGRDDLLTI